MKKNILIDRKSWAGITKLFDEYSSENDQLNKIMKIQEKNNDEHTIDYRLAEINEIN